MKDFNIIPIGTLVSGADAPATIAFALPYGFESFSITFWQTTGQTDLPELSKKVKEALGGSGAVISAMSVFGNVLTGHGGNADALKSWERVIDAAPLFGAKIITGFTGRVVDRPIEDSIPVYKKVFGELSKRAADKGLRIAFENCDMGGTWYKGDWNIAITPRAWTMMFDALPSENIGLEWEPCHQLVKLIDPIPQLRKWVGKVFHVHGKDATVARDIIAENGIVGPDQFAWHRTPGFGDTNWADVITILRQNNYSGSIDIEGYHDPVYRGELEWTGQVQGLKYLKACRGGDYVPNPR